MAMFRWTKEDDQKIKDNQHLSNAELAALFPDRTPVSVNWRKSQVLNGKIAEKPIKPPKPEKAKPITKTEPKPATLPPDYKPSTIQVESIQEKAEAAKAAHGTYRDSVQTKLWPAQPAGPAHSTELADMKIKLSFLEGKVAGIEMILQHLREVANNG